MAKKLFLLDGMALVYRAHFALINRPIYTSKGFNTSALYGFTQTLLDIVKNQEPTHLVVAFDTDAPTPRHLDYPDYKAQREAMPEDLGQALPHVSRLIQAFRIPLLRCDGWEADDIIGTLVRRAEAQGFTSYMVTPDKDFAQLVDEHTLLYKPSRMGEGVEILGLAEILEKWGVERPGQIIDVLALWGDTSDNIPGVPGIGEKTAAKLIRQYGTLDNLLAHVDELKGRIKENLATYRDQALLSRKLATIRCDAPVSPDLEQLRRQEPEENELKRLLIEFEFNTIGRRLFGEQFRAGHGHGLDQPDQPAARHPAPDTHSALPEAAPRAKLTSLQDTPHSYQVVNTAAERSRLVSQLSRQPAFAVSVQATGTDPKQAGLLGLAFCFGPHRASYVPLPGRSSGADPAAPGSRLSRAARDVLEEFRPLLENEGIQKIGHDLKLDLGVLRWHGFGLRGQLFDLLLAHSLVEPEMRHSLGYLSEAMLGYSPLPLERGEPTQAAGESRRTEALPGPVSTSSAAGATADLPGLAPADSAADAVSVAACEKADLAWQLRPLLEKLLREKNQERVFHEIESPLLPVLVDMEVEGVRIDAAALAEFGEQLARQMANLERVVHRLAGTQFNLNSPKQLGEILFDTLKLSSHPKKTRTGQYATDEQTLLALAGDHEIIRLLLEHRAASKLKSTYADALPAAIWRPTGRVHTTYQQLATATGRLNSQNPNLQNIPIRTEQGQEIRKAFVARDEDHLLCSADYSQIELRIIAALSEETALLEAFHSGIDIHTATAARVHNVFLEMVTPEMRRRAKMVNYGIAYGISAFGLAQRLGIGRSEAGAIIEQYFAQFPRIAQYMRTTVEFCRQHGYVQTVTGRRRYLRDINSSNATVRTAAERNAINAPIQGTAADMIKLAMNRIHRELQRHGLRSRMVLQVHDELVFDLHRKEQDALLPLIEDHMKNAITLGVPLVVEIGVGPTWLAAH